MLGVGCVVGGCFLVCRLMVGLVCLVSVVGVLVSGCGFVLWFWCVVLYGVLGSW